MGSEHWTSQAAGGAAVFILESMQSAQERGARIHATITGVAAMRASCPTAAGMVRAGRGITASIDSAHRAVLLAATGSGLDRIERLVFDTGAIRRRRLQFDPELRAFRFPEMFSVTPLLVAAAGMLGQSEGGPGARMGPFITLASDWCGEVRAISFAPAAKGACGFAARSILCPAESRGSPS